MVLGPDAEIGQKGVFCKGLDTGFPVKNLITFEAYLNSIRFKKLN